MTAITDARWHALRISPKTTWCFVELVDDQGRIGIGEATLNGRERLVHDAFARLSCPLAGRSAGGIDWSSARKVASTLADKAAALAAGLAPR